MIGLGTGTLISSPGPYDRYTLGVMIGRSNSRLLLPLLLHTIPMLLNE